MRRIGDQGDTVADIRRIVTSTSWRTWRAGTNRRLRRMRGELVEV